ncbi:unnamed protein product [Schistosoma rodhaini]|nr:unnamed protein product [Schistosoma rodhaini]
MAEIFYNGRRVDGRRPNEIRRVDCQFGSGYSDGIVFLHQGNTKVIASVVGPHAPRVKGDGTPDGATITCQFTKPPFASTSGERRKLSSKDRSTNDFATAIEEIFSCVIRTEKYPMSQIDIFLEVIQSDGSEFACAVNATTLALTDAGIEMDCLVSAATVGEQHYMFIVSMNFQETFPSTFILFMLSYNIPEILLSSDIDIFIC